MPMTRLTVLVLASATFLTGCATNAFVSQAKRELQDASRLSKQAVAELDRGCQKQPESCKPLVDWNNKKSLDDPTAWSTKMRPSYRVWFDTTYGDPLKTLTIKWTGLEYLAETGRAITDEMDAGTLEPHDGYRLMNKATEQAKEMVIEEARRRIQELRQRDAEAAAAISATILGTAAAALDAYAASRNIQTSRPPTYTSPAPVPAYDPKPTMLPVAECTYRLRALGGRSLCANSDGTVTAR